MLAFLRLFGLALKYSFINVRIFLVIDMTNIQKMLFSLRDEKYADFQAKLTPSVDEVLFVGVRTPELRKLAKELYKAGSYSDFLLSLPHKFFDENQLHAFIISEIRDFDLCVKCVYDFLPYIDNWATCDQLSPKVFKRNCDAILPYIRRWIKSDKTYTVRFAVVCLMRYFLDDKFDEEYLLTVSKIESDEYYIKMAVAWYFATALAKQYDSTVPYIKENRLDKWTHNKTIQKAVESYRITDEQKDYLKSLKIR